MSTDIPHGPRLSLSKPMTTAELVELYETVVLKQDFYGVNYGSDWNMEPSTEMADLLVAILNPRKHVDVGCGKGYLVAAMRDRGVTSFGIDFSEALLRQAPIAIQPFLEAARTEDWIENRSFRDADLITYMEVFEHLPPKIIAQILETLHANVQSRLLITTPSHGIDERWRSGLKVNASTPGWEADMARNVPFRQIVLQDGLPHHGHITLCSYRWWTEFFLSCGWTRARDLEMQAIREFKATLLKQRWNPYILERISSDALQIDIATSQNIGSGWHDREDNGRWTEGNAEIYIRCPLSRIGKVELELSAPEVNVIRDWTLTLVVERLVQDEDYRFQWEAAFTSFPVRLLQRETTGIIPVNLVKAPGLANSGARGKETFRLRILSPTFSPSEYGLGRDDRQLGVFCRQVRITEGD